MEPWIDCIFQHFDGITDASWRSICGTHPKDRLPVVLATIAIGSCAHHGTGFLISSTYLIQPSVRKIWYRWLGLEKKISVTNNIIQLSRKSSGAALGQAPKKSFRSIL